MRQDIDRRVGDEIDVVAAAGQGALDIAGIERLEKIQHALPVKVPDHVFLRRCWAELALLIPLRMDLHGDRSANGVDRFDPDRSKPVLNQ